MQAGSEEREEEAIKQNTSRDAPQNVAVGVEGDGAEGAGDVGLEHVLQQGGAVVQILPVGQPILQVQRRISAKIMLVPRTARSTWSVVMIACSSLRPRIAVSFLAIVRSKVAHQAWIVWA